MFGTQAPSESSLAAQETSRSLLPLGVLQSISSAGTTLPHNLNGPANSTGADTSQRFLSHYPELDLQDPTKIDELTLCESGLGLEKSQIITRDEPPGITIEPCTAESKRRIRKLEQDVRGSAVKSSRPPPNGLFKAMCATDLLFLIDTTASMMGHINAAKAQVNSIVDAITGAFVNEAEVRIAVVGYKDHRDTPNIQFLDFVRPVDRVRSFLSNLKATGGADIPEDVLGGIRQALNASWKSPTRCIIHIADAPPHGNIFHASQGMADDYPVPGSEPHHLMIDPLLQQMIQLKLNYALLRINNTTDRMAFKICKAYQEASAQCTLLIANQYYAEQFAGSLESRTMFENSKGGHELMFEEAELGVAYGALQHLVVKNVTASVSRTVGRISAQGRGKRPWSEKKTASLGGIVEDDGNACHTPLETGPAQ